jgi:hypothetical protein
LGVAAKEGEVELDLIGHDASWCICGEGHSLCLDRDKYN